MFTNAEIKAIQDDVTIMGSPDDVIDKVDDHGQIISKGALSVLIDQLKARGLDMAANKFECVGSTVNACSRKPAWLKEPTTFTDGDGVVINTRGIDICNNPVGEPQFVQMYLSGKIKAICSAIEKSSSALRPLSSHADYLACYYSYQTRFDYWFATNSVAFTGPLAVEIDENLKRVLCNAAGFNFFEAALHVPI